MRQRKQKIRFGICLLIGLGLLSGCGKQQENGALTEAGIESSTESGAGAEISIEAEAGTADGTETEASVNMEKGMAGATEYAVDYADIFGNLEGCAVVYEPASQTCFLYKEAMCETQVSPYSSFKIVSALIGLDAGVLADENSVMNYDGTQYPMAAWNKEVTLQEAFGSSCIWYFKQVIEAAGEEKVRAALEALPYGNCDCSEWDGSGINPLPDLNGFWLDSSLKISPKEQAAVLADIMEGKTDFQKTDIEILKRIMLVEKADSYSVYGKTGTGTEGKAWFVGFAEQGERRIYAAVYVDDAKDAGQVNGSAVRELAEAIMEKESRSASLPESESLVKGNAPSKEEVEAARAVVLEGMTDEDIARLKENIKIANQQMERAWLYDNLFERLFDKDSLYWNYIDQEGDIQIGWDDSGQPVMAYNRFDADNFIALMEDMKQSVRNELLQADIDKLIQNMQQAKEKHEMEYVNEIYKILHDMDYYLLRYGPEDIGKYVQDATLASTFYGTLTVYQERNTQ